MSKTASYWVEDICNMYTQQRTHIQNRDKYKSIRKTGKPNSQTGTKFEKALYWIASKHMKSHMLQVEVLTWYNHLETLFGSTH